MLKLTCLCLSLAVLTHCAGQRKHPPAQPGEFPPRAAPPQPYALNDGGLLDEALAALGMTRADLGFRKDLSEDDPFRLSLVTRMLADPLTLPQAAAEIEAATDTPSPVDILAASAEWLDTHLAHSEPDVNDRIPLPGEVPEQLREPLRNLLGALSRARREHARAFAALTDAERTVLDTHLDDLALPEHTLEDEHLSSFLDAAHTVDRGALLASGVTAMRAVEQFLAEAPQNVKGDTDLRFTTDLGPVVVQTANASRYAGPPPAVLIDLGGPDSYAFDTSRATLSVVIDLGEDDDHYRGADRTLGAGVFGIGILADAGGDDSYIGGNYSLGTGVFGMGVLWDKGHHDVYESDSITQGAGLFGVGLLLDHAGNDRYGARWGAQGFGGTWGVGVLTDRNGADSYRTGKHYADFREHQKHFQSMGQGFAIGIRPVASGGVGALVDAAGNDTYDGDYFSQGGSYWYALGLLLDAAGTDRYLARRYSQGAGIHLSAAALIDRAGDDVYSAWGVSQGCGHDLSVGLLYDEQGNDAYTADWLSQGAGNANALGLLWDAGGDDIYATTGAQVTGSGTPARGYGSIGIFLDGGGRDRYAARGRDNSLWWAGRYGVAVDAEGPLISATPESSR